MNIPRHPPAPGAVYDLVILGGGIYGAMLALEASFRGLSALVVERADFGGATSANSLRTIHGGLRYLQSLDLARYRMSVREQRWFLAQFPDLIHPLPVLMPLYRRGLRRPGVLRAAFGIDRLLAPRRSGETIPPGQILSAGEVRRLFPAVDARGLAGGARWMEAGMPDARRLLLEVLRCACALGAAALDHTAAVDLLLDGRRVAGVTVRDVRSGACYDCRAGVVLNATGPWCRTLARRFDREIPDLFRPSLAWNVAIDRAALSDHVLAVAPPRPGGRVYFIHPWESRLLVGTGHAPRGTVDEAPRPTPDELRRFLDDVNAAVPGLDVQPGEILGVYAGYLPVTDDATVRLAGRARVVDHGAHGGPAGLYSLSGVKYTEARHVAERVLRRAFPERPVLEAATESFRTTRSVHAE